MGANLRSGAVASENGYARAKGDAALAALMRERQDLADEWQAREKIQAAALGEETAKRNAEAENRERMAAIQAHYRDRCGV
jgi:hypothetical protein